MNPLTAALGAALILLGASGARAGELRVQLLGLASADGDVRVALFASPEAFEGDAPSAGVFLPANPEGLALVLRGLEPGTYALSAFHDRNRNGELDRNLVGMPSEPFGFSRDARGRFGPPAFEDMSFTLGEEPLDLEVRLR